MNHAIWRRSVPRWAVVCAFGWLLLGGLPGCAVPSRNDPANEAVTPAWPLVQSYLASWNAHDAAAATEVLAADVTYFNTSAPDARQGKQAMADVIEGLLHLMPDLRWRIVGRPVLHGSDAAFEWEFTGTARLPADGSQPARIRPVRLRGASVARVAQGHIVYFADYYNALSMQRQLAP